MSAKRLVVLLMCGVVACVVLRVLDHYFLPDNSRQIRQHISGIRQAWDLFRSTNSGLEEVQLYPETRSNGLFGVRGFVTSAVQVAQAVQFVESTHPPRPVYTNQLKIVDRETLEEFRGAFSEPWGAANRSQPDRPHTNQPPPAAGSGR